MGHTTTPRGHQISVVSSQRVASGSAGLGARKPGAYAQGLGPLALSPYRGARSPLPSPLARSGHAVLTGAELRTVTFWCLKGSKQISASVRPVTRLLRFSPALSAWVHVGQHIGCPHHCVSGTDPHSAPCRRPAGARVPGAPGRVTRRSHTRLCLQDPGGFKRERKEMARVIASHEQHWSDEGRREGRILTPRLSKPGPSSVLF